MDSLGDRRTLGAKLSPFRKHKNQTSSDQSPVTDIFLNYNVVINRESPMPLTKIERERYARQIVFPKIGEKGQERLKQGKVAILGLGAIGSAAAIYLASAGVGYIRLIDRDYAELGNLQRQILYDEKDVKEYKPKAIAAKEKLENVNSDIILEAVFEDFNPTTAERLIKDVDMVLDGTDNMETRFLLNEVCVKNETAGTSGSPRSPRSSAGF